MFGMRGNNIAFDAHYAPDDFIYDELRKILPGHDVSYITVEYYKETDGLIRSLQYLKNLQHEFS